MKAEAVKTPRSEPQRKSDPLPPANRTARTPQRDSCRKKGDAASANPKVSLPSCDRGLFDLEDVQVELAVSHMRPLSESDGALSVPRWARQT